MANTGFVALVLHAHLPYVRHPEHSRSLEERWLFEAIWECFVPLLEMLGRLREKGISRALTLSISPPLASMFCDPWLMKRFETYLDERVELARRACRYYRATNTDLANAALWHTDRLAHTQRVWAQQRHPSLLAAFCEHAQEGPLDLLTTAATHAYLPGLAAANMAQVRAQLRLGYRLFERLSGQRPMGFWLPECAFEPRLDRELLAAGARYTVLDAHGLRLSRPQTPRDIYGPILSPSGMAYFGRDPHAARDVWSRSLGYPGQPPYRDFYRDIGFDLPESELVGEVLPNGKRIASGIKLHRVTDRSAGAVHKEPYDPKAAQEQVKRDAEHFVRQRRNELLRQNNHRASAEAPPIAVAPFDAELFGHWWFEGPEFLEQVLERLAFPNKGALHEALGIEPVTLSHYLERFPEAPICEPATSSWGEGGFGAAWAGESSAELLRPVHRSGKRVEQACKVLRSCADLPQIQGSALDQAIREQLLLESSDWAFMRTRGDMRSYADFRVQTHLQHIQRLLSLASLHDVPVSEQAWLQQLCEHTRFAAELCGPELRDAFDEWAPIQ